MTAPVRRRRRTATHRGARSCPTCHSTPTAPAEVAAQRLDLEVEWLALALADGHPGHPGQLVVRRFCAQCQPHGAVYALVCRVCSDGPMLFGAWAEAAQAGEFPDELTSQLTARGWRPARDGDGWVCCR